MMKNKRFTQEEDKVLLKCLYSKKSTMKEAFVLASTKLGRDYFSVSQRWYQTLRYRATILPVNKATKATVVKKELDKLSPDERKQLILNYIK